MEMICFIYNILLIVLFTIALTMALTQYAQKRKPVYIGIVVMFTFYIIDNSIIYMTEFLDYFAHFYDKNFMSLPAFKTVVVIVYSACMLFIIFSILNRRIRIREYAVLALLAIFLLFIPMLKQDALMVWLFYLPSQLYLFYLSASSLWYMKQNKEVYCQPNHKKLKDFLMICIIFSILIVIEDTIVIFNFDIYSNLTVKINNRNMCDDILSIIFSIYALIYMPGFAVEEKEMEDKLAGANSELEEASLEKNPAEDAQSSLFYEFCKTYQLTSRECEILEILLKDKNNQEICEICNISVGTVKTHVHNIFAKVEVTKRNQLLQLYHDFKLPS